MASRPPQGFYSDFLSPAHDDGDTAQQNDLPEELLEDANVNIQHSLQQTSLHADVKQTAWEKYLLSAVLPSQDPYAKMPGAQPKVMVPFVTKAGQVPRRIAVERVRRLYGQCDLISLLQAEGIDYSHLPISSLDLMSKTIRPLPLEIFDDESYEERSPAEWLRCPDDSADHEVQFTGVPAKALLLNQYGVGRWRAAKVVSYRDEEGLFEISWSQAEPGSIQNRTGAGSTASPLDASLLPRIHVCFQGESPFRFAKRVAAAHRRRRAAEILLLYNLYIRCMPVNNRAGINSEQLKRILSSATSSKRPAQRRNIDSHIVARELSIQAARVMNKLALDRFIASNPIHSILQGFDFKAAFSEYHNFTACSPKTSTRPPADAAAFIRTVGKGVLEIPATDFEGRKNSFRFISFLTKTELIRLVVAVQAESLKLLQLSFFQKITKSVTLEEFNAIQSQFILNACFMIKETWPNTIHNHIRFHLKELRKGWFNMEEKSIEVYKVSKLRKLLAFINFRMQDTLRTLLTNSVREYHNFLLRASLVAARITSTGQVKLLGLEENIMTMTSAKEATFDAIAAGPGFQTSSAAKSGKRVPLFAVELQVTGSMVETVIRYSVQPSAFADAALNVFDRVLSQVQDITRVEKRVMQRLFWSFTPIINTVHPAEGWVQLLREEIDTAVRRASQSLTIYLATYDIYLPLLRINATEYVKEIEAKYAAGDTFQANAIKDLVVEHQCQKTEVETSIPDSINLGLFLVSCIKVKRAIDNKYRTILDLLLDLLARKTITCASDLSASYTTIEHRLSRVPANVEELTELDSFAKTVPQQLAELRPALEQTQAFFALLEYLYFKVDRPTFTLKWDLISYPSHLATKCGQTKDSVVVRKVEYQTAMEEEQESFTFRIKAMRQEVDALRQYCDLGRVEQIAAHVRRIKKDLQDCEEEAKRFNSREALFGKERTEYAALADVQKAFEPYLDLWETADSFSKSYRRWLTSPFLSLDADKVEKEVNTASRNMAKAVRFFERADLDGCLQIAKTVRSQVEDFRVHLPLVVGLRNPGMKERHWRDLSKRAGVEEILPSETLTLTDLVDRGLAKPLNLEIVNKIADAASKEFTIETSMQKMEDAWKGLYLNVESYRETGTYILKGFDEYIALLDEHITMTQAMSFSSSKGPFEARIDSWNKTLQLVSEVIEEWIGVQRNWLYLQPIFDSPDISKQLPAEGKRFATVDKHWRQAMQAAASGKTPTIRFCADNRLLERFREGNKLLEQVQKGLSDYLETKRAAFSRFYFLSNDELLEILSQTKDPLAVQPHLRKCFEAINSVDFQPSTLQLTAMNSAEGEKVAFPSPIDPVGKNVEAWMCELNIMMCQSIRQQMLLAIEDYVLTPRTQWMQRWPGQVVINGGQTHWTRDTEALVREKGRAGVQEYCETLVKQLNDMVYLLRGALSNMARMTIGALAVIDVHARDVMRNMADSGVSNVTDFAWQSQMRFYWEGSRETGDLQVVMVSSRRYYGYEYLGNSPRLVITPLTDKCYLTIMCALEMILGGAPAGPAGTGKTETTKDLAKALAKQCVVFNCSDGLDYLAMGKFFKGLASSGAWACFDEFNRINIEVLSVIAQQIMTLQGAVMRKESRCIFEDVDIAVNPEFAVFITMNPGYAGRAELPDNLEALFRPVAMMVPDYCLIAEIMLFSYGYLENRKLAQKMVATFRLCSEQLSSQDHYDYGMRAVKTVITAAGNLKRVNPTADEDSLLLRALQDVNVPKFLAHDLPLFQGILFDLFPGVARPAFDYGPLLAAAKDQSRKQNLQLVPIFERKLIELYEMICVRHGLMVVGPTGGGKSSNTAVLRETLSQLQEQGIPGERYEKVKTYHLNPKSITMGQLYGQFDVNTHEWRDGILANLMRDCIRQQTPDLKWIIFDGPVDAIWIENMNTVLDDNKKLCLTSGEIMSLTKEMTMMFEPEDLAVASPATVSQCGMIYVEPSALGWRVLAQSWLAQLPPAMLEEQKATLQSLLDAYVDEALDKLRTRLVEPLPTVNSCLLQGLLNLLDGYLAPYHTLSSRGSGGQQEQKHKQEMESLSQILEPLFLFSLIWSIGCTADAAGRRAFDNYLRKAIKKQSSSWPFPSAGLVYDYCLDLTSKAWIPWMQIAEPYKYDPKLAYSEMIIPTLDSVRYTYLLSHLVVHGHHVLMTGPTGTGKTVNISDQLQKGFNEMYIPICMAFSAQTSANQTQDQIDSKCEKRRKGVFGPPAGKKFLIFVDDVNMPQRETYGAQPPIELLRQWFDAGGWYDRKTLGFRQLIDVILIAACGPPGGGRNPVSARFFRHFNVIGYTPMQDESMLLIFGTILGNFLSIFDDSTFSFSTAVVQANIEMYNEILNTFRPTPLKPHYTFNLRDLSKVFQGILMIDGSRELKPADLFRLWVHENRRVFGDRLVDNDDRIWFENLMCNKVNQIIGDAPIPKTAQDPVCFGDFMVPGADPKIYAPIEQGKELQSTIEEYLTEYNAESKQPMHLVMFMDAIGHVARISRILRQPQGNALLLGVGGSGRKSLTKLAAFMSGYLLYQIEIAKGYGKAEWRENLKECLLLAGVENKQVVFLFNDTQIVMDQMLEDLNSVLNSGDVPNLYIAEDMEKITQACKGDCAAKRLPPTKLNIFASYILRVRRNLHIVLCMSPVGEAIRHRLRMFPSIVNCCTIDWFSEWPDEALKSVAAQFLQNLELGKSDKSVTGAIMFLHQSVATASKDFERSLRRYYYVTPTSYLELLSTYQNTLVSKREEVGMLKSRLQVGLDKLIATAAQVETLQVQLTDMQPVLVSTQADVERMIVQIGKDKADAAVTQTAVAAEEAAAHRKADETQAIAADAQRDLDEALPALDAAVACLKDLKKADIDEVKAMGRPPAGVKLTMEACCILFDIRPERVNDPDNPGRKIMDYFKAAQKNLLSNATALLESMQNFDKDNILSKIIEAIAPYITMPEFEPSAVEKASKACKAICMWVRAMYKYNQVAVQVEPKKKLLAVAQADLEQTLATLSVAQAKLKEVVDRVSKLEADLNMANNKKEQLVKDVDECQARLDRAQKLVIGLGGERTRWTESCRAYEVRYNSLLGDALISAGMIAYGGAFTPDFRQELCKKWRREFVALNIQHSDNSLRFTLSDPVAIQSWAICGLPQDSHSIENGIIMSKARRYPLLIDPQGQANRFIKNLGKDPSICTTGLDIVKLSDKNFLRSLENGIRFGRWVLLENIGESLDAAVEPLLLQQKFKQGGTEMIKVGDASIPWNDTFRFFMTTKLPNPHYSPETCVKVSLLNFAITFDGLEDQLLGRVVVEEMPDMEQRKSTLVISNAKMKKELKQLEDKILLMLTDSKGNILDDHELIETLASSKKTSQEISIKVAEAERTEEEIDISREEYRTVAYRASLLYFLVADLAELDPMYQHSLRWFGDLFAQAIRQAEKSSDLAVRLTNLNNYFTYYVYVNICRSLFEKDKLLFSFLMTISILKADRTVEWPFLISGKSAKDTSSNDPPQSDWIDARMWNELVALSTLPAFAGLADHVADANKQSAWREVYHSVEPHKMTWPGRYGMELSSFQRLCLLRCIRPDKIPEAILDFVAEQMGQEFVEPPPFDVAACYMDSSPTTPLIFVLSKGSDPTKQFYQLAAERKMDKKVNGLSLGQGQGHKAARLIEEAIQKGCWVYLQNCHLYISWLSELELICENISPDIVHKDFRLWLTSMPCKEFPVALLQDGIKMTNEPPKGLKANLKNAYFKLDNEKLNLTSKPFEYKKLLFALCIFHAVAQERTKFGALGFNIPYTFNDTDLQISREQLLLYIDAYAEIPYQVLTFLTSFINYGGRVTDYIDIRTLDVIMRSFYNSRVLEHDYSFDKEGVYYSYPFEEDDPHASYMGYIDSLPLIATPGVFGLHENAKIACAMNETSSIFEAILSLQAQDSGKGGQSNDRDVVNLASQIEKRLNQKGQFDLNTIRTQYPVQYEESMNTVLHQECIRYNKLIAEMQRSLPELQKALQGLMVMSAELEGMSKALAVNCVPKSWEEKAYPSMKPLSAWVDDLMCRLDFVRSWVEKGLPTVFWISGFYFPQNYARQHQCPIDTIDFDYAMINTPWEEIKEKPTDGVYIRGLYLEGARWDAEANSLADSKPMQLYTPMPVIHLKPVQYRKAPGSGVYQCPVYKILSRRGVLSTTGHSTNFVMWIEVPSEGPVFTNNAGKSDQEKWIKAGVAAFCSLRY